MGNISQEKPPHYYSAPRESPETAELTRKTLLLQPPTGFSAAHGGSMWARSRFQSCDQVSGIPLPFQLTKKSSISWLVVKSCLYKIIWDARYGEINCQQWLAQLHSRAPTCINPSVHKKGTGQEKKGQDRSYLGLIWTKFHGKEESCQGIYIG